MRRTKTKLRRPTEWEEGYICAVATMLRQHGENGMAKDALNCIAWLHLDCSQINEYDRGILTQHGFCNP